MMRIAFCLLGLIGCFMTGCQPQRARETYGESIGADATESLNGLSVFRSAIEARGFKTAKMRGLVSRARRLDTIVWAPNDFDTPSQFAIDWFDDWLSQPTPRVLLYVGRDFDGTTKYWQRLAETAPESDRWIYREEEAFSRSDHDFLRRNQKLPSKCDWFVVDAAKQNGRVEQFAGDWSQDLTADSTWEVDTGPSPSSAYSVQDIAQIESRAEVDDEDMFSSNTGAPKKITAREIPYPDDEIDEDGDELDDVNDVGLAPLSARVLLSSAQGDPLAFAVECPRWKKNRIIVLRNGSALLNYGAVQKSNAPFLTKLLAEVLPPTKKGRVGFLVSDHSPNIFSEEDDPSKLLGFEMLTVWPLNLVTMLSLMVGMLAMMAMLPIFGRPLRLPQRSTEDFGAHIDALGMLMQRSQDRSYALHCVIDYFRRVRKEPNSTWGQLTDEYVPPPIATKPVESGTVPPLLVPPSESEPTVLNDPSEPTQP